LETSPTGYAAFPESDALTFKQSLGWVLWLILLPVTEIDTLARRLDFTTALHRAARGASTLMDNIQSMLSWKPSQWTFYLDDLPRLAVYAVYLQTRERALREYLVHWQNIKPKTTGDDLKARGLEPGPKFAEILRQLRAAWLDGEVRDENEEMKLLDSLLA
jgi:tRNA nucleotidyltransferase (CCA-adding enzyme)